MDLLSAAFAEEASDRASDRPDQQALEYFNTQAELDLNRPSRRDYSVQLLGCEELILGRIDLPRYLQFNERYAYLIERSFNILMASLRKFMGFRVLELFLTHPSLEIHLNELARDQEIARGSAKSYCDALVDEGLILDRKKAYLRLFRLNRDDFASSRDDKGLLSSKAQTFRH